jgi:hypothetical protein
MAEAGTASRDSITVLKTIPILWEAQESGKTVALLR